MSKDEFLFSCSRRIREELKAEKSTIERIDPEQPRGDPRYVFRGLSILKYYNDFLRLSDNMELVDIYADEGITGTSINKRDDFNRMLRDSSLGKIDRIFVKSVSRFARNSLECIESIRLLKSYGTTVLFENDAIDIRHYEL